MYTTVTILLRVALILGLALAFASPYLARATPNWRRAGFWTVAVAAILLVGLRVGMRITRPERVPSFSG
ncbi:MAG: hypothetical protein R3F20_19380 [Planctomycetota bacterium]